MLIIPSAIICFSFRYLSFFSFKNFFSWSTSGLNCSWIWDTGSGKNDFSIENDLEAGFFLSYCLMGLISLEGLIIFLTSGITKSISSDIVSYIIGAVVKNKYISCVINLHSTWNLHNFKDFLKIITGSHGQILHFWSESEQTSSLLFCTCSEIHQTSF